MAVLWHNKVQMSKLSRLVEIAKITRTYRHRVFNTNEKYRHKYIHQIKEFKVVFAIEV